MQVTHLYRIAVACLMVAGPLHAQQADDVVLRAMRDELQRNLTQLQVPGMEKPFFIMYGIHDETNYAITAMLGSVVESTVQSNRTQSTSRVLVGDYSFNDESLEDNLYSSPSGVEITLPVDDDYYGIRRSFWSVTDKVYRDAARHYQKHQQTLKETGKKLEEIPHRWFAKSEPVEMVKPVATYSFDKEAWEGILRRVSARFLGHPTFQNTVVALQFGYGNDYLVSSEGTRARVPFSQAVLLAFVQTKSADGEFDLDQYSTVVRTPDQLPSETELTAAIDALIQRVEKQAAIPRLEEEYTGPVLIGGELVARLLSGVLLRAGNEGLYASDNIPRLTGLQYKESASAESKLGKAFLPDFVTVKARPHLKNFQGVDLLGSFDIDPEGIVPPEELILVENGTLKNLLNNRTLTSSLQQSNGFSAGPGVVEVSFRQRDSEKALKDKLVAQAKKDGLDYALIIRDTPALGAGFISVYKVSVADGSEQLLRHATVDAEFSSRTLRRVLGASDVYAGYNLSQGFMLGAASRSIMSMIVPRMMLLEEFSVKPFRMPTLQEEHYVSSPLVAGN